MSEPKKIALVTCASNFERYGNIVRAMHRKLKQMGGYVLYVISNYSVFVDGSGMRFFEGDSAIYRLLDTLRLDGCILEANLSSTVLTGKIVEKLQARGIPTLTVNLEAEGIPYLHLETRTAVRELMEHLITVHGCRRINLALSRGNRVMSEDATQTYLEVLRQHGIEYDERRVFASFISVQDGRNLVDLFDSRGVMKDAQAVICVHDVLSIGLCMEMQDRGFRVPGDLRVSSLNFSGNSIAFSPQMTGVDRMDQKAAEQACLLMAGMIRGKEIPRENTYSGAVRYCRSCGCAEEIEGAESVYQRVVFNKVEAGKQIGQMMQFNDALEEVESLDQLAANIHGMMKGVGSSAYFCCLNEWDLPYIENTQDASEEHDITMLDHRIMLLAGDSERTGKLTRIPLPLEQLTPALPREGDMFLIMPICHRSRIFGYTVYLNDFLPIDVYNFRICQESIGSSIENLHRQMVLRSSNEELNRLHMQDQLTGLYNRFALKRFAGDYVSPEGYAVAILDLDSLKTINDRYGHLSGNHAISIAADAIRETFGEDDLIIRYGGDEFLVLSRRTEAEKWKQAGARINQRAGETSSVQKLPFRVEISMGYAVSGKETPLSIEQAIEQADRAMYRNKKERRSAGGANQPPVHPA